LTLTSLSDLAQAGIPIELATQAGVRGVTSDEARTYGFAIAGDDGANLAGLLFPYRNIDTGKAELFRLRLAHPVKGRRYLQPAGSTNRLYLPCCLAQHLTDTRFEMLITEGERKALMLRSVVGTRYLVAGIGGVWNWRTSDKVTRERADAPGRETVRENSRAIDDFDRITFKGRTVYVVFDSDGASKPDVQRAEEALVRELRRRGAKPLVVTLPSGPDGQKQGIDDWLVRLPEAERGTALDRLLRGARPKRAALPRDAETSLDLRYAPGDGFLGRFDAYVDEATDAPAVYRWFSAFAVLSAVVGRNVTVPHGAHPLALNLYVTVLGSSSFLHKTTNISIAKRFVSAVKPDIVLPDDFTPERLIDLLQKSPQAFLAWPEFAGFLARSGRDYNAGAKELLMELYDSPDRFRRELRNTSITVERPALTVLAASATAWLSEQLKGGDLRSGFLNRFAFVLAEQKTKSIAFPDTPSMMVRNQIVADLNRIGQITGEADFSAVKRAYTQWYHTLEREASRAEQVEIVSAFYTRLSITAIKLATLIELARTGSLTVSSASLDEAIVLTDYLRAVIRHLLRVEFAPTDNAKRAQRVLQVLTREPGIRRGWLLKKTGYDSRQMTEALHVLTEQGDAYEQDGGWWPTAG
jgi:hypothetical protein